MTIIWWTLYIIGAITILILWINLIAIIFRVFTYILKKEWCKVIEGPPGPQGPQGPRGSEELLGRKDIESLIRMEVAAGLTKLSLEMAKKEEK